MKSQSTRVGLKVGLFAGVTALLGAVGCATEAPEETARSEAAQTSCPPGQVASFWYDVQRPDVPIQNLLRQIGTCTGCAMSVRAPAGYLVLQLLDVVGCDECLDNAETQMQALGIDIARARNAACVPDPNPSCASQCRLNGFGGGVSSATTGCGCTWDAAGTLPQRATCSDNTPGGQCSPAGYICQRPGGTLSPGQLWEWGQRCTPPMPTPPSAPPCTSYDRTFSMHRCGTGPDRDKLFNCGTGFVAHDCAREYRVGCRTTGQLTGDQRAHDQCVSGEPLHD